MRILLATNATAYIACFVAYALTKDIEFAVYGTWSIVAFFGLINLEDRE